MMEKFAASGVDTGGKFAVGVVDTGGNFAAEAGGKLIHEKNSWHCPFKSRSKEVSKLGCIGEC